MMWKYKIIYTKLIYVCKELYIHIFNIIYNTYIDTLQTSGFFKYYKQLKKNRLYCMRSTYSIHNNHMILH